MIYSDGNGGNARTANRQNKRVMKWAADKVHKNNNKGGGQPKKLSPFYFLRITTC